MKHYKSPLKKLVSFFEKSRNSWKEKALRAKKELKICKNRIKFLEVSKDKLKQEIILLKKEKSRSNSEDLNQLPAEIDPPYHSIKKKKM